MFNIILTQGINRQIRRMCEYLGFKVKKEMDEHGQFIDNFSDLINVLVTYKMT